MDRMSLLSILAVSVPEAILNIYFGFLVTGEKVHLYLDDKVNIIRLSLSIILMVITSVTTRFLLPNAFYVLLANILVYTLILKLIFKLKWSKSSIVVIIFMTFLVTIELIYLLPFMTIFTNGQSNLYNNDIWRIISSLPERFIQVFTIISLWNVNSVFFNIKEYRKLQGSFMSLIGLLIVIEAVFAFIFLSCADLISVQLKVIFIAAFFLFSVINFSLFRFIINLANTIMKNDVYELIEYKKKVNKKMADLNKYINEGNLDSAKELCKKSIL